jgi:hypothetical protein
MKSETIAVQQLFQKQIESRLRPESGISIGGLTRSRRSAALRTCDSRGGPLGGKLT